MEVSTDPTTETMNMYNYINNFLINPVVYIILLVVLVLYFVFFYSLGNNNSSSSTSFSSETKSSSGNISTILVIILVVVLLLVNGVTYFFGINLSAYITGLFSSKPVVNVVVDETNVKRHGLAPIPEIPIIEEVFNIPGNYYSYEDSKALCDAYGAKLATYQQIENAYNRGGEWCNYGWSDEQMALYPTQQKTFQQLQKIKGHEHDCGRPGINGGYIANPEVKFGVNCYGHKPMITQEEKELMQNGKAFPQTIQDQALQKRVDYWKEHVDDILVSPFNRNTWSKI
jgi:hypothetical protein